MAEMLEVRITGRNELQIPIDQAEALLKRFGDHAGALNVNVANSAATGAVAFGNVYAQAFGKIITLAEQAAAATIRFGAEAIVTGVKFNAQMETSRLGIAALVSSFGEIRNTQGELATGATKWAASLSIAEDIQKKLLVAARETPATYTDLLKALQVGMGPGLAAGLNGDQMVKFTQMVSQAAGALGIAGDQLGQEIRSLFMGDIGPDSRLANLLFSDVPREKVKAFVEELKASGKFFDEMEKRMSSFSRAGADAGQTLTVGMSNLQDAFEQAMGESTQNLTSELAQSVRALTDVVGSPEFGAAAKSFADSLATIVDASEMLIRSVPGTITAMENLANKGKRAFNFMMDPLGIAPAIAGWMGGGSTAAPTGGIGASGIRNADRPFGPGLNGDAWVLANRPRGGGGEDAQKEAEKLRKELEKQLDLAWKIRDSYGEFATHEGKLVEIEKERLATIKDIRGASMLSAEQRADLELMADAIAGRQRLGVYVQQSPGVVDGPAQFERTREALSKLYDTVYGNSAEKAAKIWSDTVHAYRSYQEKKEAEDYAKAVAEGMRKYEQNFAAPFSNMLYDLATSGGRNFGQAAGENFNRLIGEGASALTDAFAGLFGGGNITQDATSGQWFINGQPATQAQVNHAQGVNRGMGQAMNYASIGIGSYMGPKASGQDTSILGGAASGAMAGFSSGGYYGAVIGAVVGALGTYFGNQSVYDTYKYGIPGINVSTGQMSLNYTQEMQPAEVKQWTARMQQQFDTFWNGYVDIILKLGDSRLIPALEGIDGQFQRKASKNFLKHLEEWINGTLPDEIAGMFKDSMGTLYTSMGLTMEGFETFWKRFDNLDPKKALELWGLLADALINFQETITAFGGTLTPGQAGYSIGGANNSFSQIMSNEQSRGGMTFAETLRESDKDLMNMADSLEHLTGEQQIRRAKEISDLMEQRYEKEKEYARQLIQVQEEINRGWDAMVRSINLSGMTNADGTQDTGAQVNYLYDYLNQLYAQMGTATSPEELAYLNQEAQSVLSQILSIAAQSGDPEYIKAMQKWALDAIKFMREQTAARIKELGDEVSAANAAFLEKFEPIFSAFQDAFQSATDAIDPPGGGGIAGAIDELRPRVQGLGMDFDDLGAAMQNFISQLNGQGRPGSGQSGNKVAASSYDYGAGVAARRRRIA